MVRVSDNQIHDLWKATKLTPKKLSKISEAITLEQVVTSLAQDVIDKRIINPPYWGYITVGQIIWGNGKHWKDNTSLESMGLMKHAGLRRPANFVFMDQVNKYGYMMQWPPREIHEILIGAMNDNILNPSFDSTVDIGYHAAHSRGKIDKKTGKYLPQYRQKITTYFLWSSDQSLWPEIQKHIISLELWVRKQWLLTLERMPETIAKRVKLAEVHGSRADSQTEQYQIGADMKSSLLESLNPEVPPEDIDWRNDDSDGEGVAA